MVVTLKPITQATLRQVLKLAVSPGQASYVASNAVSLAQALFHPAAWYRAIYLDDDTGRMDGIEVVLAYAL